DSNSYYNIWVISCFDNITNGTGTLGYAQLAAAHGTAIDGAVLVSHSFRDTGSKSESHELGHALNLYHTFEGDGSGNTCPVGNGCGSGSGDCCADTPPHKRSVNPCNTSGTNSCDGNSSNLLFAKNYMDYSSNECRNMFTANQKTRMVSALTTTRSSYLSANGNDKLVPTVAPTAGFLQDVQSVCVGGIVTFSDRSACIPNTFQNDDSWPGISFSWTLANGATVLTSTLQNPSFTLTVPGFYDLAYTVTNSFGSNTVNVLNAVVAGTSVVAACSPTSQYEGFYGSSLSEVAFNNIHNYTAVMTNVPYHDYCCTKNTIVTAGQTYPLKISFKSGNTYTQAMEAYIDFNNNGLFDTTELVQSGNINPGVFSYSTGDVTIPDTAVKNTLLRMRIISEAAGISDAERTCSSQYFTSDVEDYGVYITDALGIADFDNQQLHYYPNPVNDVLNIASVEVVEKIAVYNLLGQLVLEIHANIANPTVNFSGFTNGVYLVTIFGKDQKTTFKVIKQ
ncbi:MAG TPA: M43 family zinc metalloprotease, partial [Flavobacterium sp.]|nr:M43 family zinc metalloprotease [Flavobacterium sp.]